MLWFVQILGLFSFLVVLNVIFIAIFQLSICHFLRRLHFSLFIFWIMIVFLFALREQLYKFINFLLFNLEWICSFLFAFNLINFLLICLCIFLIFILLNDLICFHFVFLSNIIFFLFSFNLLLNILINLFDFICVLRHFLRVTQLLDFRLF